jgi:hypothetical protein
MSFRIEIKPSASGLCWDIKTLSDVDVGITSDNASGFDYIAQLFQHRPSAPDLIP